MADYTDLPDTAVGIGGIPSGTTVTALRDNAIAIAEGAVGAPRVVDAALDVTVAYYGGKIAQLAAGSVGSYALARRNVSANVSFGGTVAGSTLVPTGSWNSQTGTGANAAAIDVDSAQSGSWRCMGVYDNNVPTGSGESIGTATLWLRIS